MNIKKILTLIVLCIIIPQTYTMELVPLEEEKVTFTIDYNCPFLNLPIECIDTIIFYGTPETIGALKNSCKYLAERASILRINDLNINHFRIHDYKALSALFKNIVKTDKPEYIKKILEYGRREALFRHKEPEDSTVITLDESEIENEYLMREYLSRLFQYAIEQNKYQSVCTLIKNGAKVIDPDYPLEYAARCDSDAAIQALFACNTYDENEINEALDIAWFGNKQKALELLSTKTDNNRYLQFLTYLTNKRYSRIKQLIYVGTLVTITVFGCVTGLTFQILKHFRHNNVTMH